MIDWLSWLLKWELPYYFGRHDRKYPADDAIGYRYNANIHGNDLWLCDWSRVIRAIPAEGTLEKISWKQSPQVQMWMDDPKPTIRQRLAAGWRR